MAHIPSPDRSSEVRSFYEKNTRLFLALGGGGATRSVHRAVWGEEVSDRDQAFAYVNRLILEQVGEVGEARPGTEVRVLDLGCGVGGTLFYLAERRQGAISATGVTLSPLQVRLAQEEADRRHLEEVCRFVEADFHDLPPLGVFDVVYAVEAFVLSADPDVFFRQAARDLRPGGRLVLIDDFLTDAGARPGLSGRHRRWIEDFRRGWHADGLVSDGQAAQRAAMHGLRLASNRDLTPYLELGRVRDRLIAYLVAPWARHVERWPYVRSLAGGHALQQGLRHGLIAYRCLVFQRTDSPTPFPEASENTP